MKRFKYLLLVSLTVVSGFFGGVVSNHLFERPAVAQESESKRIIEAQEFRLVDEDGKVAGILGNYNGNNGLSIFDDEGNERISLKELNGNPRIFIFDKNGKIRIGFFEDNGGHIISINDENGKVRIVLGEINGNPSISICDENDKTRIFLTTSNGQPSIRILDDENRDRAVLGCTDLETIKTGSTEKTSESSLTLFDKEGKVFWRVPND